MPFALSSATGAGLAARGDDAPESTSQPVTTMGLQHCTATKATSGAVTSRCLCFDEKRRQGKNPLQFPAATLYHVSSSVGSISTVPAPAPEGAVSSGGRTCTAVESLGEELKPVVLSFTLTYCLTSMLPMSMERRALTGVESVYRVPSPAASRCWTSSRTPSAMEAALCPRSLPAARRLAPPSSEPGNTMDARVHFRALVASCLPLGQLLQLDVHRVHGDRAVVLHDDIDLHGLACPRLQSINTAAADSHPGPRFEFREGRLDNFRSKKSFLVTPPTSRSSHGSALRPCLVRGTAKYA